MRFIFSAFTLALVGCQCEPIRGVAFKCSSDNGCAVGYRCINQTCTISDGAGGADASGGGAAGGGGATGGGVSGGGAGGGATGGGAGGGATGGGAGGGATGGGAGGGATGGGATGGGTSGQNRLVFATAPSASAFEGLALATQPKVAVQDAVGNVISTAVNVVTLTAYSDAACQVLRPSGTLEGAAPLSAVAGYATFSRLAIYGTGTVYLSASSPGLLSACSAAVAVGGGLFTDVAASRDVVESTNSDWGWVAASDLDGDGRPDLAVGTSAGHQVFFNAASGPWRTGPLLGAADRSVVLGDCNNDGWRDVFTTSGPLPVNFFRNARDGGFNDERVRSGLANQNPEGAAVLDYDRDGLLDYVQPDGSDAGGHMGLWRNTGDCVFTETTAAAGLPRSGLGNGEQVIAVDFDADGDVDLLYTRSQGLTNGGALYLYRNNGNGTFTDLSTTAKLGLAAKLEYRAGVAVGDWDNDGDFDLFIGRGQGQQRSLLRNDNGTFVDVTASSGDLATSTNAVEGCSFGDFDNDGWLDLFLAGSNADDELYRNLGGGAFVLIDQAVPADTATDRDSTGVAVADVDLDGDLDAYVANRGVSPSHLYLNGHGGPSFLKVKVRGRGGAGKHPADGSGAVVQLFNSAGTSLLATREVSGGAFAGQNDPVVHFGLAASWGGANGNYVVKVRFNSGLYTHPMTVRPASARLTIGSTTLSQTIEVVEP